MQMKAKERALEEDAKKYGTTVKEQSRDDDYMSAVNRGDMETAQRMVDEAAGRAFPSIDISKQPLTQRCPDPQKLVLGPTFGGHVNTAGCCYYLIPAGLRSSPCRPYRV